MSADEFSADESGKAPGPKQTETPVLMACSSQSAFSCGQTLTVHVPAVDEDDV